MATSRPTFHESWYRIAQLHPKLLSSIHVYRQHYRGQMWYVLEDSAGNKFSRINDEAYRFIAMLDGKRTVADVWGICNDQLGDRAPTQPEVIQLLGQLYSSNLLHAELSPEAQSLFNRYKKRIHRQLIGYFSNLLFVRIPLFNPDNFLDRWVGLFGQIFTWPVFVLWSILIATGLYYVIVNMGEFAYQSRDVLAPDNLILLYLSFNFIKVLHEFGHSFACKKFGKFQGSGGRVHTMGVMFLVFIPLPYMDASSAWAFRQKWHRVIVGAAGVMVELAIAAIATIFWANTSTGTAHIIAYNLIFIAGVSTLFFNGNPLLRFDGYYILSDMIEIPNLSQRSKSYLHYLVKRYCWGTKKAQSPAYSRGERIWFGFYGIASTLYRVFICVRILLFLNDRLPKELFILVPFFASVSIFSWVLMPLGKFLRFLATSPELARNRFQAVAVTLATVILITAGVGVIPVADYCRIEGIVEPVDLSLIYTATDGFVVDFLPSGTSTTSDGLALIRMVNPVLQAQEKQLIAERQRLEAQRRLAQTRTAAEVQILDEQIAALDEKMERTRLELSLLNLHAPKSGVWVAPEIERTKGAYLQRGEKIGFVASLDKLIIRAIAGQGDAAKLIELAYKDLEIRVKGRPSLSLSGRIKKILPGGQQRLPSAALGYAVGGSIPTLSQDPSGTKTAERFFEIQIIPDANSPVRLLSGQRVIARIKMPSTPLIVQWWSSARQLFQRRFHI